MTIDQIFEVNNTALDFGQHWTGVGVPFSQTLTALDLVAFLDMKSLEP